MQIILIVFLLLVLLDIIYVKNYKMIRNLKYKKYILNMNIKEINLDEILYSPSIVSYLYNQKIEPKKDIVADIVNLFARKIINIKQRYENKYEIVLNKEKYEELNFKILENDKYLIHTIIQKIHNFDYEEWQRRVKKVYRENLLKDKEEKNNRIYEYIQKNPMFYYLGIPIIIICILVILFVILKKNITTAIILGAAIGIMFVLITQFLITASLREENKDMHLGKTAEEELKKWLKFETYIKEYTALKERTIEDVVLFEKYIAFAMVLGVNKKSKKEIKNVLGKDEMKIILDSIKEYNAENYKLSEYYLK